MSWLTVSYINSFFCIELYQTSCTLRRLACAVVPYCYCTALARRSLPRRKSLQGCIPFLPFPGTPRRNCSSGSRDWEKEYQANMEPLSNPNRHWYAPLLPLPHNIICPGVPRALMNFAVWYLLILPRTGKWSIWKVFSVPDLNFACGKLFLFVQ